MIPMTKNIYVADETEKIIGSTYLKRALGLVKKGRARWVNADTICLCARDETEDNKMANNIYEVLDNQISKMQEQLRGAEAESAAKVQVEILRTMEKVQAQQRELKLIDMIEKQLNSMSEALASEPATTEYAAARESTRQEMLKLMSKLMDRPADGGASAAASVAEVKTEAEAAEKAEADEAVTKAADSAFTFGE